MWPTITELGGRASLRGVAFGNVFQPWLAVLQPGEDAEGFGGIGEQIVHPVGETVVVISPAAGGVMIEHHLGSPGSLFCRDGNAVFVRVPPTKHSTKLIKRPYRLAMRRLPPLTAVRAFEAAARHENFTLAAAELGMTQAAVSYQIKLLEERLGVPLFRREKRRVLLTEAGRRAAAPVAQAFDAIDGAFAQLRAEDEAMLAISTSQTFANTWLAWRLGGFQMAHPEMAVRLLVSDAIADFAAEDLDVAIRAGLGPWPGLDADPLIDIDFTPMCSPEFLERHGGRIAPKELIHLPMISPHDPWWQWWLYEAGVDIPDGKAQRGIRMDSQANEGNAAMAGLGVAMLTPFFWRNDIAQGRLVRLSDQLSTRGYGYWLVAPEHRRNVPKIKRFREWLLAEVAKDLAGG